jgi:hypothetical protein
MGAALGVVHHALHGFFPGFLAADGGALDGSGMGGGWRFGSGRGAAVS